MALNEVKTTNGHAEPVTRAWDARLLRIEQHVAEMTQAGEQRLLALRDALGDFVAEYVGDELAERDSEIATLNETVADLNETVADLELRQNTALADAQKRRDALEAELKESRVEARREAERQAEHNAELERRIIALESAGSLEAKFHELAERHRAQVMKGDRGDRGLQGPKGDRGPAGPAGRKGKDGEVQIVETADWHVNRKHFTVTPLLRVNGQTVAGKSINMLPLFEEYHSQAGGE